MKLQGAFLLLMSFNSITYANSILPDSNAPFSQRPDVLEASQGVPQINIQTPSPAGVSRNQYSQFDIEQRGAILNNASDKVETQLAGQIAGNPHLANGAARVILNEVTFPRKNGQDTKRLFCLQTQRGSNSPI
ncbi:MAG: hypothetical protein U1E78_05045 [Gammaproteobacteria bacterium]